MNAPGAGLLEQAIAHHRAGRLGDAEQTYRLILQSDAAQPDANHNLGMILARRGRLDLGLAHFQAAFQASPATLQYRLSHAEALIATGRAQDAMPLLLQAKQQGVVHAVLQKLLERCHAANAPPDYPKAVQLHQAGRLAEAVVLYRQILAAKPDFFDAQFNLANALATQDVAEAIPAYRRAIALKPDIAQVHASLGNALRAAGALPEAIASFRKAVALAPDFALAYVNLGNALKVADAPDDAAQAYRKAISLNPGLTGAHMNLGNLLLAQGRSRDAIASYRQGLKQQPDFAEGHLNLGNALKADGAPEEAAATYRRALQLRPDYAEAHNNLGNVLMELDRLEEAEAAFRAAIQAQPGHAEAYNNLGNALMKRGAGLGEAIGSYERAIALKPDYVEAYDHLGVALCNDQRIAEGFSWFTRGAKMRYGTSAPARERPAHQLRHDDEQQRYLGGEASGGVLHLEHGERLAGPAINLRNNVAEIERVWTTRRPQIAVIDNLLTPEALAGLRRFCHGSTMWREAFADGYLGAKPESGFAAPLLAQVAEELRQAYPAIFRDHPLLYSWAFKYDHALAGTSIHADFAAVNVNFWITPDEANRDPDSGGLKVWDVAAPLDWDFVKYNTDETAIHAFLRENNASAVTIPYRANRAVIFDSDLFHETDRMDFAPGYENRRINITLLYGRRGT